MNSFSIKMPVELIILSVSQSNSHSGGGIKIPGVNEVELATCVQRIDRNATSAGGLAHMLVLTWMQAEDSLSEMSLVLVCLTE